MATGILTAGLPNEALNMGSPVAEYKISSNGPWVGAVLFGLVGLGSCGVALLAAVGATSGEDGALLAGLCVGAFSLLMWGGAAWMTRTALRKQKDRVVVFDTGLVRASGSKNEVVRWDELATVFQDITHYYRYGVRTRTRHVYTLFTRDNRKVLLTDSIVNVEALGNTIQQEVTRRLLPQYTQAYNSGGSVTFGRFTLNKAGLSYGGETIPWEQVEAVNINQGRISVRKQGKWLNWAGQNASSVPNLIVFLTLVDQIIGINTKK